MVVDSIEKSVGVKHSGDNLLEKSLTYLSECFTPTPPSNFLLLKCFQFSQKMLDKRGENLSGVLYNLCQNSDTKTEVLEFVKSLPEQDIEEIGFIETPRGEVMLELTETFGGTSTPYDATTLSDGTLRVLSIAAVLLSAPEESIVVIEEIDNGVHPSRAESLLKRIDCAIAQLASSY